MFKRNPLALQVALVLTGCSVSTFFAASVVAAEPVLEEIVVWGQESVHRAAASHPSSMLTPQDLTSINVATTEDVVKFEPSLVIRRRFIGDSNGTMGMRGANMFQTSRSMVFADGVPLHYLLQSRWNGAPRWTMVSASEIAQVEVLYGPFSAEYSGNSMGGVVLIESAIPQQREFHFDSTYFSQSFDAYGFDETINGYKSFLSFGDKIGDTSVYVSYNRLESDSQPQIFYYGTPVGSADRAVSGGVVGNDELSNERLWFGDTGTVSTVTDNYKIKIGHDFGDWEALLNLAYENLSAGSDNPNTYIRDAAGNPVWSGNVVQDGIAINIPAARLGGSEQERDSLSVGLRVRGPIADGVDVEANFNDFRVLSDRNRAALINPADPAYTGEGEVTRFGDTGWRSAEVALTFDELPVDGLELVTGVRHDAYELNMDIFRTRNHLAGAFDAFTSRSGGETRIDALFAQLNWAINESWDMGLGVRWESFESDNGYFSRDEAATPEFDLVPVPRTSDRAASPKFSLGYQPSSDWRFSYAFGKAYRFPIVEELFSQYSAYNSISTANPELGPEIGLHHNFSMERQLDNGVLRVNLFQESVKDVVESQSETLPGGLSVRTFIPLDEVETQGVEFIANLDDVLVDNLNMRFNVVYTHSEIVKNDVDTTLEGNIYPRMPKWRGNLLLTYYIRPQWDVGLNLQYASSSYGRLDNRDHEEGVYGAQDSYTRAGLKTTYNLGNGLAMGLGVDNITNDISFVSHPWPGRTYYANLSYAF